MVSILLVSMGLFLSMVYLVLTQEIEEETHNVQENKHSFECKHDYDMIISDSIEDPLFTVYKCKNCGDVVGSSQEALWKMGYDIGV